MFHFRDTALRGTGSFKERPQTRAAIHPLRHGAGGADMGANVLYRYGTDDTRHRQAGYNTLTGTQLWPWPNEARIKAEMCAATSRGFCSAGLRKDGKQPISLTSYIWEAVGNAMPASF